jgi:hypothetical protein
MREADFPQMLQFADLWFANPNLFVICGFAILRTQFLLVDLKFPQILLTNMGLKCSLFLYQMILVK